MGWDPQKRFTQHRTRAASAEARAKKYKSMVSKSGTFRQLHDEALAEFHVFDRLLRTRGTLATPAQLQAALLEMKASGPDKNIHPFDPECFELARLREINLLIRRIEVEIE